jgi:hypothetical protein
MKVSELAGLLDSLVQGLERVKGTASVTKDLKVFEPALRPFAERSIADFTSFLLQCEEYQRTGIVPGKKTAAPRSPRKTAGPELVASAVQAVQALLSEIQQGLVHEQRVEETLASLQKLTKPQLDEVSAGLNIAGKAKTKAQAVDRIRQVVRAQLEMHDKVRLIRDSGGPEAAAPHS